MNLAPIVLFVYNRPWHTEQTLNTLALNNLADKSVLYIYCDGPKKNASEESLKKINEVRQLVKAKKWCKEVIVIEKDINLGLANSVIKGVTEVIEKHGSAIVLEDDIITGTYFLKFMNDGLNLYKDEKEVFGVSGLKFPSSSVIKKSTYFLPIMSSWGYGTWVDRWNKINFDGNELLDIVKSKKIENQLDFGTITYYKMLKDQTLGKNDSWAVRFYVSMFLQKGVFLYPNITLLKNIGLDGTGVHCNNDSELLFPVDMQTGVDVKIVKQKVMLDSKIVKSFTNLYPDSKKNKSKEFKSKLSKFIAPELKAYIKRKLNLKTSKSVSEFDRLKLVPRYVKTSAIIHGKELQIPDSASFLFMYDEIFKTEIYKFKTKNKSPYIIDGGANIGLASIYFKQLYPSAEIVAFEPDPFIFDILQANIKSLGLDDVKLINKGLWNENTSLKFQSEGADAGILETYNKSNDKANSKSVSMTSLRPYIKSKVDLLKLDIEGAETVVLKDIAEDLDKVDRIFVEYHSFVGQQQTLNELINILTEAKFRIYMSIPGNDALKSPFMGLSNYNNMDFQLNIFGFKQDCN